MAILGVVHISGLKGHFLGLYRRGSEADVTTLVGKLTAMGRSNDATMRQCETLWNAFVPSCFSKGVRDEGGL